MDVILDKASLSSGQDPLGEALTADLELAPFSSLSGLAETSQIPRLACGGTPCLGQCLRLGLQRAVLLSHSTCQGCEVQRSSWPQPPPSLTPSCSEAGCLSHLPESQLTASLPSAYRPLLAATACGTASKHFGLALKILQHWPRPLPLPPHTPRSSHTGFIIIPRACQACSLLCSLQKWLPFPGIPSAPSSPSPCV